MYKKIDFQEAKELMDSRADLLIVDVREEGEYITGHAIGAELLPMSELTSDQGREIAEELIPSLDTPLMLYCRTGRRSRQAADILAGWGYSEIYNVGSLAGWPYGLEY